MTVHAPQLYIGLISGTSLDGIDTVISQIATTGEFKLVAARTHPIPRAIRQRLLDLSQKNQPDALDQYATLDNQLGRLFAEACNQLLDEQQLKHEQITAIGSHGQTIRHYPDSEFPTSLQIADPNIIAEQTGITTVADFRRRDMAAGGQGAPLVPPFHKAVFQHHSLNRVILNIGGIANITVLPAASGFVTGFDTGPGNGLLDNWCLRHHGCDYDKDGLLAAQGRVIPELLMQMCADPYFSLQAPKSTGREYFTIQWIENQLNQYNTACAHLDVLATLTELTAQTIADAIKSLEMEFDEIVVCGGGSHNPTLIRRIGEKHPGILINSTETHGLHPDWIEASAFSWLAHQTISGVAGNLPRVTGAGHAVILGGIWPGNSFDRRMTGKPVVT